MATACFLLLLRGVGHLSLAPHSTPGVLIRCVAPASLHCASNLSLTEAHASVRGPGTNAPHGGEPAAAQANWPHAGRPRVAADHMRNMGLADFAIQTGMVNPQKMWVETPLKANLKLNPSILHRI